MNLEKIISYIGLVTLVMVLSIKLVAQNGSLIGRVWEKSSQEPLPGASVYLTDPQDSTVLIGTVADSMGRFEFAVITPGVYVLNINFLGFLPYQKQLSLAGVKDLGTIFLEPSELLLNSVTVTDERASLIHTLDNYKAKDELLYEGEGLRK